MLGAEDPGTNFMISGNINFKKYLDRIYAEEGFRKIPLEGMEGYSGSGDVFLLWEEAYWNEYVLWSGPSGLKDVSKSIAETDRTVGELQAAK